MSLKVVILGGTRGIGRAVARRLAERGDRVHLLGRDADELARCAADLQARMPGGTDAVTTSLCDLERPESFEPAIASAGAALGGFDTAVVTAGMFAAQPQLEADRAFTQRLLTVNFANTVLFCEHLRTYLLSRGGGTLCVFSSVAGDRGRKPVILYGAAKAGLSAYLEGLDHKFRSSGLKTICVKPGFVRTGMTEGLPEPPFAADADQVAASAVKAIDRAPVVCPANLGAGDAGDSLAPRAVMRRVGF